MSRHPGAGPAAFIAAILLAVSVTACDSGSATPTPPQSSPSASLETGSSPARTLAPTKKPTVPASPETTPPAADVSPDPADSPSAYTGPGAGCTGTDDNKKYWGQAASLLTFDVYCPVLPAGWYLIASSFDTKNGGVLTATYTGKGGAKIEIKEGKFCTTGVSACSAHDVVLGTAKFGDRTGSLDTLGPALGYAIYINPGAAPAWSITGTGMTQDAFVAVAGALVKVPKN